MVPLLVFSNKQDLINAVPTEEIIELLELNAIKDRPWHIQACSAKTGVGLEDGMKWACTEASNKDK